MEFVKTEFGHYRLNGKLLSVLQKTVNNMRGKRYQTELMLVETKRFITTNGKEMVVVICPHKVPVGLYFITTEGFLLRTKGNLAFPDYKSVMLDPNEGNCELFPSRSRPEHVLSDVIAYLNRGGMRFNVISLLDNLLPTIGKDGCAVRTFTPEKPFEITFDIESEVHVTYVQMPLS